MIPKALVVGDSRMRYIKEYQINKQPVGHDELDICPLPGATLQDVLSLTKDILQTSNYSLVYICGGVNNLTRMTGKSVVVNETCLSQMPVYLISLCQIFLDEADRDFPHTKFVFCPVFSLSIEKYNCHLAKKPFIKHSKSIFQKDINETLYRFNKYMKNTVNSSSNLTTPEYDKGIVYYTPKRGVLVNHKNFWDGLHQDTTLSVKMYEEILRCKRIDFVN